MKQLLSDVLKTNSLEQKRRILNKYSLTKEDKNEFLTAKAEANGGGDVSSNEYYYLFDGNAFYQNLINDTNVNVEDVIDMYKTLLFGGVKYFYYNDSSDSRTHYLENVFINPMGVDISYIKGFIMNDITLLIYPYFIKGNWHEFWDKAVTIPIGLTEEEIAPFIDNINNYLTLVSKEEFYSVFTYKPEII